MSLTNSNNDYVIYAKKLHDNRTIVLIFKNDIFSNCFIHNNDNENKNTGPRINIFTRVENEVIPIQKNLIKKYQLDYIQSIDIESTGDHNFTLICFKTGKYLIVYQNDEWSYDNFMKFVENKLKS